MRDLVRHDRKRGEHAERGVDQKRAGDDHPVGKIVKRVADQDRQTATACLLGIVTVMMVMRIALVMMRVMNQREFLEQEETENAEQNDPAQRKRIGVALKRLGQQVRNRCRQQQPGRNRHQLVDQLAEITKAEPAGEARESSVDSRLARTM